MFCSKKGDSQKKSNVDFVDGGHSGPGGPCGPCGRCGPHCVGGRLQCRFIVLCFLGVSGSVGITDAFLHRFSSNPTDSVSVHNVHTVHNVHIPAYSSLCLPIAIMQRGMDPTAWVGVCSAGLLCFASWECLAPWVL